MNAMKTYAQNSPEAMSRVVAMMIVTDAHIDNREIAVLDRADAYQSLGISRENFMRVARDYCSDLVAEASELGETLLVDPDRVDNVIDSIDMADQRIVVARLLLIVMAADNKQERGELALLDHIFDRWRLTHDEVAGTVHG
jgi:uncharacterized tellurite resistance protein B-like protein